MAGNKKPRKKRTAKSIAQNPRDRMADKNAIYTALRVGGTMLKCVVEKTEA